MSVQGKSVNTRYVLGKDDPMLVDGRVTNKTALRARAVALSGRQAQAEITRKITHEAPPLPFNLTKLTSFCANKWDMTPGDVMKITQSLRDDFSAISYNRSDCQYLSTEQFREAPETVAFAAKNLGLETTGFDTSIKSRCFNDANLTAHYAIIPTASEQDISKFSLSQRQVYDAITRFYLAQFLPPAKKEVSVMTITLENGAKLTATSTKVLEPGYRTFLSNGLGVDEDNDEKDLEDSEEETQLSTLIVGSHTARITSTSILDKETTPPARYTLASLAEDMTRISKYVENQKVKELLMQKDKGKKGENGSIGTTATRPAIVGTLLERKFIVEFKRGNKTYIKSTELGRAFYNMLPDAARKVDVTAKWFVIQEGIKSGEYTPD